MRAQLTVFIIIGALVVIAFGLTFYVGSKVTQPIKKEEPVELGIAGVEDYITTCLELATTEGLNLIGRQGGAIYKSQGGITPAPRESVQYTDTDLGVLNVSFLIIPPAGNVNTLFYAQPPEYPFPGFPYAGNELLFTGYYGISRLPPLYRITPEGERVTNSIQENLETFIAKRTAECATWETFEEKGYTITAGQATATLLFANQSEQMIGEQNLNVELLWPIEVTTPEEDKTLLERFAIREPIRLATIYFTVKSIIDADVTNISFIPGTVGDFTVETFEHGENTFVIVKDSLSMVANKPFEFWIPRKNRRPALWQIDEEPLKQVTFHITPEGRGAKITTTDDALRIEDPCQEPGVQNPYIIELRASEPDENPVTFEASAKEIPRRALDQPEYKITVYAKDHSTHPDSWFDSQEIPLQVALCEVR